MALAIKHPTINWQSAIPPYLKHQERKQQVSALLVVVMYKQHKQRNAATNNDAHKVTRTCLFPILIGSESNHKGAPQVFLLFWIGTESNHKVAPQVFLLFWIGTESNTSRTTTHNQHVSSRCHVLRFGAAGLLVHTRRCNDAMKEPGQYHALQQVPKEQERSRGVWVIVNRKVPPSFALSFRLTRPRHARRAEWTRDDRALPLANCPKNTPPPLRLGSSTRCRRRTSTTPVGAGRSRERRVGSPPVPAWRRSIQSTWSELSNNRNIKTSTHWTS